MNTEQTVKRVPRCIGFILDGNRRWAKEQGLSSFEGHQKGMDNVETIARAARDMGIQHMVVYAFSTENWERSEDEISYLFKIFESMAREGLARFTDADAAVRFVGQIKRFPLSLQEAIRMVEAKNPKDPRYTLWICLSYGSRAEITHSAQEASREGAITEESISKHLWTRDMPDPDLIVRTSGEQRISNFLLWQGAYSELFFLKKHWPEFTIADLQAVLKEYAQRERRVGK